MTLSQVFSGFGCSGKNISPSLKWINAPRNTKSFAVTVYDPDAPTGSGWWHWVIFNIPAGVNELKADAGRIEKNLAPAGSIQSVTDFGKPGFGGACPPQGDKAHRYIFTVYALSVAKLDLDEKTSAGNGRVCLEQQRDCQGISYSVLPAVRQRDNLPPRFPVRFLEGEDWNILTKCGSAKLEFIPSSPAPVLLPLSTERYAAPGSGSAIRRPASCVKRRWLCIE